MTINRGRRLFTASAAIWAGATMLLKSSFAQTSKTLDINIVNTNGTAQSAFEKLFRRQGYLEEVGLNAKTINVSDGSTIMAALIGGTADVCMTSGFGQVLPGVEHGAPVRVIAGGNMLISQGLMTGRPDIKSIADLKGKTIGTGALGSLEYQLMVALLSAHKVDVGSVHFVNIGNVADIYRGVVTGRVDAGPVSLDVYGKANGNTRIIADLWTELPDFPYLGSYTSVAAIQQKREALVRTLAAYAKMYRFLMSPAAKQPYIEAYVQANAGPGAEAAATRLWQFFHDTQGYAANLVIPDKSLNFMQTLNVKTGSQKAILPLDRFSDMSLAREAIRRLGTAPT